MGRGSSKRHKQNKTSSSIPTCSTRPALKDIENAYYNALMRKSQHDERQQEERRQQLLNKIGRKDYTHLHPFKAWWCELGNMVVQLWKMRKLRKEDMYEHTFTTAFIKAILSTALRILNLIPQSIGMLYVALGFLQLINWEKWEIIQILLPNVSHTVWWMDILWMISGLFIGCFAMFMKFVRWEMEKSTDNNYLLSIISIAVSIGLCFIFPA